MTDDAILLRKYAEQRDEQAFTELVRRHINLVYSTALRQTGDPELAQDLTQTVFADLAARAKSISREVLLGGWLYRRTCFTASNLLRGERRRQAREREAVTMNVKDESGDAIWRQLAPVLDEAMNGLAERDRDALVLRFFQQQPLREVGAAIGATEDAARMRVDRALEKLRTYLTRRGVTLSAMALSAILGTHAVAAAPGGLELTVCSFALAGAVSTGGTPFTLIKLMSMTKLKTGIVAVIVATGIATPVVLQHQVNERLRMEIAGLRRDNQIIAQLRAENQRLAGFKVDADELEKLRKQHLELLQLRSQAAVFRLREQELAQAQEALRRVQSGAMAQNPAATGAQQPTLGEGLKPASEWTNAGVALVIGGIGFVMKPASEWTNAGLGTPSSAFETWNWARAKGDVNALAGALALDDDARAKAETLLASLPDSVRAKYGSVEQMMAAGQLSTKPIVGACVSSEDTMGDNDKVIRTQWQNDSGELGASDWRMHRFDDGWRVVISAGQVDKLERMVKTGRALAGAGQ